MHDIVQIYVQTNHFIILTIYMRSSNWLIFGLSTLLILTLLTISTAAKEVNNFNLLLPTSYHATKGHARQIVITSGGCYDWQSTDASIVKVKGTHHGLVPSQTATTNQNCNSNGIVELMHEGRYPSSVYITARDRSSTQLISIPVRIRDLKKISIFTKSKIMSLNEIQNLQVYGFDSEQNTFTSLEGLRFKWIITEIEDGKYSVGSIEKIPLSQSSLYMPLDTRKKLQAQQRSESDLLVIRAKRVGKVLVKVLCNEPNYELISDSITLYIQQKFEISPALTINMLAGSTYQYYLKTPSGSNISLPSSNYQIKLSNPLFSVSRTLQVTAPRRQSRTELKISDIRTQPAYQREIRIQAFQPDQIQIIMLQNLVIGQEVNYELRFFNKKKQLVGNLDPVLLNVKINEDHDGTDKVFILHQLNRTVTVSGKGTGVIIVEYNGIISQKKIYASTPLKLVGNSNKVVLPIGEIYQFSVVGGSGLYKYSYAPKSEQDSLITMSFNGLITTRKEGLAEIVVSDEKNPNNAIEIKVYVIKIGNIESLQQNKQFMINQDGSLYITATPRQTTLTSSQTYTQCNDALLRGLAFTPTNQTPQTPLQILNTYSINHHTLSELRSLAETNHYIQRLLNQRSVIKTSQLLRQYSLYIKYNEIKESELERIIHDMENYGLCTKVLVKPVAEFQGAVAVRKTNKDQYVDNVKNTMKLRVYQKMSNRIDGLQINNFGNEEVYVVPFGQFRWKTHGGPYGWEIEGLPQMEVYINEQKVITSKATNIKDKIFPLIKCPRSEKSQTYVLTYRNPKSASLLRPVSQQTRLTVHCHMPDYIQFGLPTKQASPISLNPQLGPSLFTELKYKLNNDETETVYMLPNQCIRIVLQPLVQLEGKSKIRRFYNASNLVCEIKGNANEKIRKIELPIDVNDARTWNTRIYTYDNKLGSKKSDQLLTVVCNQIYDPQTKQSLALPTPITQKLLIKTLSPLKIKQAPQTIELANLPNSETTLVLQSQSGSSIVSNRFSIKCNEGIVKCTKNSNNQIILRPNQGTKNGYTTLRIHDEFAIQSQDVVIPVRVFSIDGVELAVAGIQVYERLRDGKAVDGLKCNVWVFDGDYFVVVVNAYAMNITRQGRSLKKNIGNIDPNLLSIQIQKNYETTATQISKKFDPINNVFYILFKTERSSSIPTQSSQGYQLTMLKLIAVLKLHSPQQLLSNKAVVQVYHSITLQGISQMLAFQQLQIGGKAVKDVASRLDAYVNIMESCSTFITVVGGPANIKTRIVANPGQGTYFNLVKLNQRNYRVESIHSTQKIAKKQRNIQGKQHNLISIIVYNEQNNQQLTLIRCLVQVTAISSVQIQGNNQLLTNKQTRYLTQLGSAQENQRMPRTIREECSLRYQWSVRSPNVHINATPYPILQINSNAEKIGVNVASVVIGDGVEIKDVDNNQAELSVVVYSQKGREIGRAHKKVRVVFEDGVKVINENSPYSQKNKVLRISSDQFILIPPNSGLKLPKNTIIQQLSPCDKQQARITTPSQNYIQTGQTSPNLEPELVKLRTRPTTSSTSAMPIYSTILITDICAAMIQNVDGSVSLNPTNSATDRGVDENLQLVKFDVLDCYGRKFYHYAFKGVQHRVFVTDPNVASASIYSVEEGLISLQGHNIGTTQLILQVIHNGITKAKDVLPITVNLFIQPSKPLSVHIGDIVSFKMANPSASQQKWSSSDNKIVKINSRSGQAVAYGVGQSNIKLGPMSTRLSVVKIIDLIKKVRKGENRANGYDYEIVYEGKKYVENKDDLKYVQSGLEFRCEVLGKEGQFLRANAQKIVSGDKEYIRCNIQKIPGTSTIQSPIKLLKLSVHAQNKDYGFRIDKQFQESLDSFVILSQRHINPKDPKYKRQKHAVIVIQTSQRLDISQSGGKDSWIVSNQFNGARQIISIDISQHRNNQFSINIQNPQTKQLDKIIVSTINEKQKSMDKTTYDEIPKDGWKWTDVLVVFMAVNFLLILGYQIMQANGSGHLKVY